MDRGLKELGQSNYDKLAKSLQEFNLGGAELVIFGYENAKPMLFEVRSPGRASDLTWQGYAVVGSGTDMALGSIRHKPFTRDLEDTIYRLLEAKFSSETGNVGKPTVLLTMNQDIEVKVMKPGEVEAIRAVWKLTQQEPIPADALSVISKSRTVTDIADGER